MAGHNKWNNIKYRKAVKDAKRDKIFTKIIRELVTAASLGCSDPNFNPRLRAAIDKALLNNMTKYTLNRAIARGISKKENINIESNIYEGYGPGGIAIMLKCLSEDQNFTISKIHCTFKKFGGNLSSSGSVSYLFRKKGIFTLEKVDENVVLKVISTLNIEDITIRGCNTIDIYTTLEDVDRVHKALAVFGLKVSNFRISLIPSEQINIDTKTSLKLLRLINILESYDSVQDIYHNGKFSEEISSIFQ